MTYAIGDTIRVKVSHPNGTINMTEGVVTDLYPSGNSYGSTGEILFSSDCADYTEVTVLKKAAPADGAYIKFNTAWGERAGLVQGDRVHYVVPREYGVETISWGVSIIQDFEVIA